MNEEEKNLGGVDDKSLSPTQVRSFPLRVVLTVTTDRLLTEPKGERDNGIGDLYEILNWVTGDNLFTHQLPRAGRACKPWLLQCFPELAVASTMLDELDRHLRLGKAGPQEAINIWLNVIKTKHPEIKDKYQVSPMPEGWLHIDPLIEAEAMVGKERMIVLNAPARDAGTTQ